MGEQRAGNTNIIWGTRIRVVSRPKAFYYTPLGPPFGGSQAKVLEALARWVKTVRPTNAAKKKRPITWRWLRAEKAWSGDEPPTGPETLEKQCIEFGTGPCLCLGFCNGPRPSDPQFAVPNGLAHLHGTTGRHGSAQQLPNGATLDWFQPPSLSERRGLNVGEKEGGMFRICRSTPRPNVGRRECHKKCEPKKRRLQMEDLKDVKAREPREAAREMGEVTQRKIPQKRR